MLSVRSSSSIGVIRHGLMMRQHLQTKSAAILHTHIHIAASAIRTFTNHTATTAKHVTQRSHTWIRHAETSSSLSSPFPSSSPCFSSFLLPHRAFSSTPTPTPSDKKDEATALTTTTTNTTTTTPVPVELDSHGNPIVPVVSGAPVDWRVKSKVIWGKVKAECKHYWLGTKLLWKDIKIAYGILKQIMNGHEMNRRERKRMIRTAGDLIRMIPFIVIMIVPFAEFALPVLLKFFPNMLPSTYLDVKGAEATHRKQLVVKTEMAKFLQETAMSQAKRLASSLTDEEAKEQAAHFRDFMSKVRSGKKVLNSDIVGFSKLFDSDLTLENLSKEQLSAMCRLLDIKVFGSDWVLRYKLQGKLRQIQADDQLIAAEGIGALSTNELIEACRARGIYTEKDESYLKRKLGDWIELSLVQQVPVTLLLLSRAFSRQMAGVSEPDLSTDLASTLAYVPEVVVSEAEKSIVDLTNDPATKLESIQDEALELAMEEVKARKEGASDAKRLAKLKLALASTDSTKDSISSLEQENVKLEKLVDSTVENEEKEGATAAAAAAAATPASTTVSTPTPTPSSIPTTTSSPTPVTATTTVASTSTPTPSAADKTADKKKDKKAAMKNIDQFNDKLGNLIKKIKKESEEIETGKAAAQGTTETTADKQQDKDKKQ